jgi:hypothetical protein
MLAEMAADRPESLASLLLDADAKQFAVLVDVFAQHRETGIESLAQVLDQKAAADSEHERLAKRQANGAAALVPLRVPDRMWPPMRRWNSPRVPGRQRAATSGKPMICFLTTVGTSTIRKTGRNP